MSATAPSLERALAEDSQAAGTLHVLPGVRRSGTQATLDLVTTRDGFEALEKDWNALFDRAGRDIQLFQGFNWLWHWANHFLPKAGEAGPQLAIVTAYLDGRLVMVWPLVSERLGPLTRLSWMGEPVSQYGDLLIDDVPDAQALLRAAWDFVTRRTGASVLKLRKVRDDAAIAPSAAP